MFEVDQKARFGVEDAETIKKIDKENEKKIIQIINEYGYPNQEILGEEGLFNFWLLIQHVGSNIDLQEQCLKNCNFKPQEYAFLYDRIQVNKGLDQKYGTQLNKIIRNLNKTNEERVRIGWVTLEEWIRNFNETDDVGRIIKLEISNDGSATYLV